MISSPFLLHKDFPVSGRILNRNSGLGELDQTEDLFILNYFTSSPLTNSHSSGHNVSLTPVWLSNFVNWIYHVIIFSDSSFYMNLS